MSESEIYFWFVICNNIFHLIRFPFQVLEGHSSAVICLIVSGRLLYSGSADGTAKCWVIEFGDNTRQYRGHKHSITCMKLTKGICKESRNDDFQKT